MNLMDFIEGRFIIIISLLASIVLTEFKEEYKDKKNFVKNPLDKMALDESKSLRSLPNELQSSVENLPISGKKRRVSRLRNGRTTYVKAILSNPKILPSQQLAEKLARAELKSPKMQETFKKLTAIHTPSENFQGKAADSKITSPGFVRLPKIFDNSYKPPRFKERRKRKRKRHKTRRRNNVRRENFAKKKINHSHSRLTRQIANISAKNDERQAVDRYEKSISYNPDKSVENMGNDENFQEPETNLNVGLNYPDVEVFDSKLQNFGSDDDNSFNYGSNFSPIDDQPDNFDISNSMRDNTQDFPSSNDELPDNRFSSPEDNSRIQYNEKLDHLNSQDNQERRDPRLQSRNYGFSSSNQAWFDQNGISGRKNVKNPFDGRQIGPNKIFQGPNTFNGRRDNFRNNYDNMNNYGRNFLPSYSNYRSGSLNSFRGQKNLISKFRVGNENSSKPEVNLSTNYPNSTKSSVEYSRARKSSKVQKTDQSIEKMISNYVETCTPSAMNPKLEGIGEASAVPPETIEKTIDESRSLKGMEYHLLPSATLAPEADMGKTQQNRGYNAASANETKEVAGQILNKIIEELEDLKLDRSKNEQKEGLPCKLSGSWITTQAGVRIDMLVTNRSVNASMAKLDLPVGIVRQSLLNYTWNLTGQAPFKRGGPFSLIATDNHTKSLAVFVGACRICQGIDTIEGVWSIAREPRDCRDFQMATSIYNDIFRRTNLLSAIKEKQLVMMMNALKYTSTTAVPISKQEYYSPSLGDGKVP